MRLAGLRFYGMEGDPDMSTRPVMPRSPHHILEKTIRMSSWPLWLLMMLFFATGYMMSGEFGLGRVVDVKNALAVHKALHFPLLVVMLVHAIPATYLTFQRWTRKQDKT